MADTIATAKALVREFRAALYDCDRNALAAALGRWFSADAAIRLPQPLGDVVGADGLFATAYAPLLEAFPDLERRDYVAAGGRDREALWVGCGGYYTGVFEKSWLGIPPTRHLATIRYIEFFRIDAGKIVEAKLLWDIPSLMMQANAWPMAPSLGVEFHVPGPATQDGIIDGESDRSRSAASKALVDAMVQGLGRYAEGGAEAMQLEQYWHPKMNWYGPAGIGSNRRLSGFRNWHQVPFLNAMPNRRSNTSGGGYDCFFADGDYVLYCGWPGMAANVTGDGWMGIVPAGQALRFSSLDIWRCEHGLIRENWVLIDILDIWKQLGVDVLARMRELTIDRQPGALKP